MIEVHKYLQDKQSNMLLQVHDEIICEIHDDELHTITYEIKNLLEKSIRRTTENNSMAVYLI